MISKADKEKFDNLKRRAAQRARMYPSSKSGYDAHVENENARELLPMVYKQIEAEVETK